MACKDKCNLPCRMEDCVGRPCLDMLEALSEIAFPIMAIQLRAERDGMQVNGVMAVQIASDANYLRDIARKALEKIGEDPAKILEHRIRSQKSNKDNA